VFWLQSRSGSTPVLPLYASIDLLVWNPDEPNRQGLGLADPGVLPLRTGDRVRVAAQLSRPAFIYVVWLDAQGVALPVYPWHAGEWDQRRRSEQPQTRLAIPERRDAAWMMQVPQDGMETLLLLGRPTELPPDVSLPTLLKDVGRNSLPRRNHASWFQEGSPLRKQTADARSNSDKLREPVFDRQVAIDDPLLKIQQQLAKTLRPHFELIHAVSFPVQGE
jgi:hypothetical protein